MQQQFDAIPVCSSALSRLPDFACWLHSLSGTFPVNLYSSWVQEALAAAYWVRLVQQVAVFGFSQPCIILSKPLLLYL